MVYNPIRSEYVAVGVVGLLLFSLILISAQVTIWLGIQSRTTLLFFAALAVMAVFEFPRYGELAYNGHYDSAASYSVHIFAGNFFFLAFSIVCQQWSTLLKLGTVAKRFYGRNGIFIANVVFLIVDVVSVSLCLTSASLDKYFRSPAFIVLSCIEAVKNCTYTSVLSYNGIQLVLKLWNYSQGERQRTSVWRELFQCCKCFAAVKDNALLTPSSTSDGERASNLRAIPPESAYLSALMRLTFVLLLSTACFLLRIAMLVVKIVALATTAPVTTPSFTLFGFLWTVLADFVPRVLPSLAFMFLMRSKRPRAVQSPTARGGATDRDKDKGRPHHESSDQIVLLQIADRESLSSSVVTV